MLSRGKWNNSLNLLEIYLCNKLLEYAPEPLAISPDPAILIPSTQDNPALPGDSTMEIQFSDDTPDGHAVIGTLHINDERLLGEDDWETKIRHLIEVLQDTVEDSKEDELRSATIFIEVRNDEGLHRTAEEFGVSPKEDEDDGDIVIWREKTKFHDVSSLIPVGWSPG